MHGKGKKSDSAKEKNKTKHKERKKIKQSCIDTVTHSRTAMHCHAHTDPSRGAGKDKTAAFTAQREKRREWTDSVAHSDRRTCAQLHTPSQICKTEKRKKKRDEGTSGKHTHTHTMEGKHANRQSKRRRQTCKRKKKRLNPTKDGKGNAQAAAAAVKQRKVPHAGKVLRNRKGKKNYEIIKSTDISCAFTAHWSFLRDVPYRWR